MNFNMEMFGQDHNRNNAVVRFLYICVASLGRPLIQMQVKKKLVVSMTQKQVVLRMWVRIFDMVHHF